MVVRGARIIVIATRTIFFVLYPNYIGQSSEEAYSNVQFLFLSVTERKKILALPIPLRVQRKNAGNVSARIHYVKAGVTTDSDKSDVTTQCLPSFITARKKSWRFSSFILSSRLDTARVYRYISCSSDCWSIRMPNISDKAESSSYNPDKKIN